MRAATVDSVLVPSPRVHKRLHHQAKRHRGFHLQRLEQVAKRFILAAAARQILDGVMHLVLEKALQPAEVHEVADGIRAPAVPDEIADGRAVRIATRERREIIEAQLPTRLPDRREQNVCGVQSYWIRSSRREEALNF